MRVTRYLWINNLPVRTSEQDIRDVLQSHGKIQSVRLHSEGVSHGAVVAFVDTKSATRAVESTVRLNKITLSLQYCESSGVPGIIGQESLNISSDSSRVNNSSLSLENAQKKSESRSLSIASDSDSSTQEADKRTKTHPRSHDPLPSRSATNGMESSFVGSASTRYSRQQRGLYIRHLPLRSSDTNLREGLFHEYKKHGKITSVVIHGQGESRHCIITFKRGEDAERALEVSRSKVFFGIPISVSLHEGVDSEDPDLCPPEHALDEYHPKATKTLFVGNLNSNTVTQDELRRTFRTYGEIIEIDIKLQANQPGTSYAFVQFSDIKSVVRALSSQDAIRFNGKSVKLGFGKSQPTNVVWLDNLAPSVNEAFLTRQFGRYGHLTHVVLDKKTLRALLYFDKVEMAQRALNETRNRALVGRKVQLDYAGYECQVAFMRRLAKHDGFGQVYDNYRERLQELLSLWPSYGGVLPLFDRQRYLGDSQRGSSNIPSDDGSTSSLQRKPMRHLLSVDRSSNADVPVARDKGDYPESTHNTSRSARNNVTSKPNSISRHRRHMDEDANGEDSPMLTGRSEKKGSRRRSENSPISRSSAVSHHLTDDDVRNHLNSRYGSNKMFPESNSSSHWQTGRHVPLISKGIRSANPAYNLNLRSGNHYLDETDDVSSGSLSPELDACESSSDVSPVIRRGSRFSKSPHKLKETSKELQPESFDDRKPSHFLSPVLRNSRGRNCDSPQTLSTLDTRKVSRRKNISSSLHSPKPQSSTSEHHASTAINDESVHNQPTSHRKSTNRDNFDEALPLKSQQQPNRRLRRSAVRDSTEDLSRRSVSGMIGGLSATPYSSSFKTSVRDADHTIFQTSEDSRVGQSKRQVVREVPDNSIISNDTLTKLELERAKLLRELSLLNNEVVGGSKVKPNLTGKRTPLYAASSEGSIGSVTKHGSFLQKSNDGDYIPNNSSDFQRGSAESIMRETYKTTSKGANALCYQSEDKQTRTQLPVTSAHSSLLNGCHSSSSEPGELLSPLTVEHPAPSPVPNPTVQPATSQVPNKIISDVSSSLSGSNAASDFAISQKAMLSTSSPRLVIPPEPTSPLMRLSSPDSPLLLTKVPLLIPESSQPSSPPSTSFLSPKFSVSSNLCGVISPPLSSMTSTAPVSTNRDPRLIQHTGQLGMDIPPPPPENLKIPLWVDTSNQLDSNVSSKTLPPLVLTKQSSLTKSEAPILIGTEPEFEMNSSHDASGCSLDERIRLLDAQLLKSEKARPAVDYSKFRIKRKGDSISTGAALEGCSLSAAISDESAASTIITNTITNTSASVLDSPSLGSRAEHIVLSDRCSLSSTIPSVTTLTSISPSSSSLSSSFPLPRPADTSEFVKSMLSSKPSPSTPVDEHGISSSVDSSINSWRVLNSYSSQLNDESQICPSLGSFRKSVPFTESVTPSFSVRPFGTLNSRHFPPTCGVSYSPVNGLQPVGVATRLPSNPSVPEPTIVFKEAMHSNTEGNSLPVRSILKKDVPQLESVPSRSLPSETIFEVKPISSGLIGTASNTDLISTSSFKHGLTAELVNKADKSHEIALVRSSVKQQSKRGISHPTKSVHPPNLKQPPASPNSPAGIKRKLTSSSTVVSKTPTVGPKIHKRGVSKPFLDDSMFLTSLESVPTSDKTKRARLDSKRKNRLSVSTVFPSKHDNVSREINNNTQNQTAVNSDSFHSELSKHEKNLNERIPFFEKHKCTSVINAFKARSILESEKLADDQSTTRPSSKSSPSHSSKGNLNRKRRKKEHKSPLDSDGLECDRNSTNTSKVRCADAMELSALSDGYESMYDKIKRRANKGSDRNAGITEADALQRLLKGHQKSGRKQSSKKAGNSCKQSIADSDTDECLSDESSSADEESLKAKRNVKSNKIATHRKLVETPRRIKQKVSCLTEEKPVVQTAMKKNVSVIKKRKAKEIVHRFKTNIRANENNMKVDGVSTGKEEKLLDSLHKKNGKAQKLTEVHTAFASSGVHVLNGKRRKSTGNLSKETIQTSGSLSQTDIQKKRKKLSNPSKERSLVHRVFASTDSDTPSSLSSSSSSDLENVKRYEANEEREKIEAPVNIVRPTSSPLSRCSTPHLSRSCSPDDLDADAAIRHTFGAFASPFNAKPKENPSTPESHKTSVLCNASESSSEVITTVTKATPPTLPMSDSSLGTDQLLNSTGKTVVRDSSEWNIFTSINNCSSQNSHSCPVSSSPARVPDVCDEHALEDHANEPSYFDDELPSLEKHDDEEYGKSSSESIVLNESLLQQEDKMINLNDDDLPPPVVSVLGDPSSHHLSFSDDVTQLPAPTSNVIEEVVYDNLEIHVPTTDSSDNSFPQDLNSNNTLENSVIEENVKSNSSASLMNGHHSVIFTSPSNTNVAGVEADLAFGDSFRTELNSSFNSSTQSTNSFNLKSTMFAPLTVLAPAIQSNEVSKVGQPLLVTVPGAVTGGTFTPSSLTLLPASVPICSGSQTSSLPTQRHVALILPATSVSLGSSLLQSVHGLSSASLSASTPVCSESVSAASELSHPGVDELPTASAGVCVKSVCQDIRCATNVPKVDITNMVSTAFPAIDSFADVPTASLVTNASTTSVTFNQSDFTSYVQRVIERVKQEKDEEILHQREKVKRPKKVPNALVSISSTVTACSTSLTNVVSLPSATITSPITPLPLLAPMPTIPGVNVCPRPPIVSSQTLMADKVSAQSSSDNHVLSYPGRKQNSASPAEPKLLKTNSSFVNEKNKEKIISPDPSNSLNDPTIDLLSASDNSPNSDSTRVVASENLGRDTVDEVIDAVVEGQFDESEFVQNILKGNFDHSLVHRRPVLSPTMAGELGNSSTTVVDESLKLGPNVEQILDDRSQPSMVVDLKKSDPPNPVFSSMHVLTFVAAGAGSHLTNAAAVSPAVVTQATGPIATSHSLYSCPSSSVQAPLSNPVGLGSQLPTTTYSENSYPAEASVTPSSDASIEHLAAQFVSNPLTSYFYSLLAQQQSQQIGTTSYSTSSPTKPTAALLSGPVPSALQTSLKGLTVPSISTSNDTADYLAAATMAAMAAMVSPSGITHGATHEVLSTNAKAPAVSVVCTSDPPTWSTESCTIQGYPVAWEGRLSLKNEEVYVQMHYLNGNQDLLKACMNVIAEQQSLSGNGLTHNTTSVTDRNPSQPLRIVQRMRLEPSQLEGVQRKLRQANDYCACLTIACAPPLTTDTSIPSERARMNQILCDGFIKYMLDKSAAGIINVCHPCTQQNLFVIHIFPPCDFSRCHLESNAPALSRQIVQNSTPHLLIIVTTV